MLGDAKHRWRERNREHVNAHAREYRRGAGKDVTRKKDMRLKYGITLERYDELLASQGGVCAICGVKPEENKKKLSVDHCHSTKKVRGILCYRCNTGLASLKDSVQLVEAAATYLGSAKVRSHDELVAALKVARTYTERVVATMPTQRAGLQRQEQALRDVTTINAALAKAEAV